MPEYFLQSLNLLRTEILRVARLRQDHQEVDDFVDLKFGVAVDIGQLEQLLRDVPARDNFSKMFLLKNFKKLVKPRKS